MKILDVNRIFAFQSDGHPTDETVQGVRQQPHRIVQVESFLIIQTMVFTVYLYQPMKRLITIYNRSTT